MEISELILYRRTVLGSITLALCLWGHYRADPRLSDQAVRAGTSSAVELRAPVERDSFSVVLFGDRTGGDQSGMPVLAEGVRMANHLDPDFVMTVGDMVDGYNEEAQWLIQMKEYRDYMSELDAPWYPVAGNHDVYASAGIVGGHLAAYQQHFGPLYYSFDYKWAHFAVLFTDESLSFSDPARTQNMGQDQLEWLTADLAQTEATQVYVFLHHPRWTAQYNGCNWPDIHEVLKEDGRVSAVFAGHQHRWRDDGLIDGIHYYVTAVTGGHQRPYRESADRNVISHLKIREDGFEMAVMPVGAVHGGDVVLGSEVDDMESCSAGGWCSVSGTVVVSSGMENESQLVLKVENPRNEGCRFRVEPIGRPGWNIRAERSDLWLEAGESSEQKLVVVTPPTTGMPDNVRMSVTMEYALSSGLKQPLSVPLSISVESQKLIEAVKKAPKQNMVLLLDGASSVRVPLAWDHSAFTLECWVRGTAPKGWSGLVAKTQTSGFSINWNTTGGDGHLRLKGSKGYTVVGAGKALDWEDWNHLAFCWDGEEARFYVNGELTERTPAEGEILGNHHPLYIGADTNHRGNPEHAFTGAIDEVRISKVARYNDRFRPKKMHREDKDTVALFHFDRVVDGVFPDASGNRNHGWATGKPVLEPETVR
ncbi:MAG: putative phosphohydrolase [Planctomycetota bacterium]|jgi:predicted phosphohydrolase